MAKNAINRKKTHSAAGAILESIEEIRGFQKQLEDYIKYMYAEVWHGGKKSKKWYSDVIANINNNEELLTAIERFASQLRKPTAITFE